MTQRDEVNELRDAIEELQTVTVPGLESERDYYKHESQVLWRLVGSLFEILGIVHKEKMS